MKARFTEPMLCVAVAELPSGPEWSYELKLDGYRGLVIKTDGRGGLLSRKGKDLSARFPGITRSLRHLPDDTVIDGEIVAPDAEGRPSFSLLQNSSGRDHTIAFYAFDLLLMLATTSGICHLRLGAKCFGPNCCRSLWNPSDCPRTLTFPPMS